MLAPFADHRDLVCPLDMILDARVVMWFTEKSACPQFMVSVNAKAVSSSVLLVFIDWILRCLPADSAKTPAIKQVRSTMELLCSKFNRERNMASRRQSNAKKAKFLSNNVAVGVCERTSMSLFYDSVFDYR